MKIVAVLATTLLATLFLLSIPNDVSESEPVLDTYNQSFNHTFLHDTALNQSEYLVVKDEYGDFPDIKTSLSLMRFEEKCSPTEKRNAQCLNLLPHVIPNQDLSEVQKTSDNSVKNLPETIKISWTGNMNFSDTQIHLKNNDSYENWGGVNGYITYFNEENDRDQIRIKTGRSPSNIMSTCNHEYLHHYNPDIEHSHSSTHNGTFRENKPVMTGEYNDKWWRKKEETARFQECYKVMNKIREKGGTMSIGNSIEGGTISIDISQNIINR